MSENINEENAEQKEVIEHFEIEYTTREEYIGCAYSALVAVTDLDTGLMNKTDQLRVKRIRKMCLRILDDCVKEMHDELFENEED